MPSARVHDAGLPVDEGLDAEKGASLGTGDMPLVLIIGSGACVLFVRLSCCFTYDVPAFGGAGGGSYVSSHFIITPNADYNVYSEHSYQSSQALMPKALRAWLQGLELSNSTQWP